MSDIEGSARVVGYVVILITLLLIVSIIGYALYLFREIG